MESIILDNIRVLTLDIRTWSGRSKLRPEDLKLTEGSELPPESLARLGSKLIMDPEKLSVFVTLRQAAAREALFVGTRFLGGYAIPIDELDGLMQKLGTIKTAFEREKEEFLNGYSDAVQSWIDSNPGWEAVIKNAEAEPEKVRKAISFATQVFSVSPVEEHQEGLVKEVEGLGGQLRHEIEVMAQNTWKRSFQGQKEVTQRAMRPIRTILKKIEGLVFLEPELNELIEGMKGTLDDMPKKGLIKGRHLSELCGILAVLGNIPEAKSTCTDDQPGEEEASAEPELELSPEQEHENTPAPHVVRPIQEAARPVEWF